MNTAANNCIASLMTAKAVAAISSIQLVGSGAEDIIKKIFKPFGQTHRSAPTFPFTAGSILHGHIFDGDKNIDEVIIGCEQADCFSINCHGNPLIVEDILELLKARGAKIAEPQEVLAYLGRQKYGDNTIAIEADIVITQAATLDGAKIIAHQTRMGLLQTLQWWLKNLNVMQLDDIKSGASRILSDSRISHFFIKGAKVVIAGPPNSGKSTLFNYLCGKEKAIVTDIAGTTRDWLSAQIRLRKIAAEFFDTAGLDEILSSKNLVAPAARCGGVDAESQKQAALLIKNCDIVLFILDVTKRAGTAGFHLAAKEELTVFNKCDLLRDLSFEGLNPPRRIKISAKTGSGINELIGAIEHKLGVSDFDMKKTVCWTDRQRKILEQIASAKTKQRTRGLITELLKGTVVV
jgi:tRNA modification GTPase